MGPTFLYGDSDTPPHLVAFYDHAGDTEVHILDLTPRALPWRQKGGDLFQSYDKSPYTNRNVKRASDNTNNATKKFD